MQIGHFLAGEGQAGAVGMQNVRVLAGYGRLLKRAKTAGMHTARYLAGETSAEGDAGMRPRKTHDNAGCGR